MKKTTKPTNKPTLVAFLLDRSGSMADNIKETVGGFNGYIDELIKQKNEDMRLTLTQFDSVSVDIVHESVPLKKVNRLVAHKNFIPRGNTPLYDAMGKTIRETEKRAGDKYKVLFVTLTDGYENASGEWDEKSIKELVKAKEDNDHWTFAYIGVGREAWGQVVRFAAGTQSYSNVANIKRRSVGRAMAAMACATASYSAGGQGVNSVDKSLFSNCAMPDDTKLTDEDEE